MGCKHTQTYAKAHQPEDAEGHEDDAKRQQSRKNRKSCVRILHTLHDG